MLKNINLIKFIIKETLKLLNFLRVISVSKLPKPKKKIQVFYGGSRSGNIGGPVVKIKKLKRFFPEYKNRFNIIYSLSNNCLLNKKTIEVLQRNNYPIILNQNGVYYPAWYKGNYADKNLMNKVLYHQANYVFWQSKFCKSASEKFLGKRKNKAGEILYNAVDTNLFKPKKQTKGGFNFLITGNISRNNNYRISSVLCALKEVLKYRSDIYLTIAGNIVDKKSFILEATKLGIIQNINFIGKFKQIDAPKIYQMADAYITMSYQDNCPSAVIEAMSCGLPILYSASGGIPELVDQNSGIGLKVDLKWQKIQLPNLKDISEGMIKITENKNSMSEGARERAVEKFDIEYWINRHEYIFDLFLKKVIR